MNKEYTYNIDKYTIGVNENGENGIGVTVAIIKNGGIYFLSNCYGENARCIDLLIKENQELKKQLEEKNKKYIPGEYATETFSKTIDENILLKNQQKDFIKYLEDESKEIYRDGGLRQKIYKEILQKYKSIIGDDK